ncbi:serine/threonine-protein kinase [Polyangium jinanense]|uniref:Protein kinase n=1 Tax=Polyangium jinanense TaxID=2829994 RepID=A0A9X3XHN5_9BACT|nr:serine/threonine-protein kinase [Polyangium jinanense]MDC3962188.1 protein kinase [Polyangium jinanense]MDC3988863.1 protein kinase [Polyangium jinanense]
MKRGDVIAGRFEIEVRAGAGGMGTVYRAHDRATGSPVALKVIHQPASDATRRFDVEARALAELSHPHVVRYVTHGLSEAGFPYLVMEWLEGEDLATRLARGPLTLEECLLLARRVAAGLGAAHARGIVHRDVKPTNLVLVGRAIEGVKLVDFGLAQLGAMSRKLTRSGMILGTPGYMAPEQASGDGAPIDARADVFSLGAVLYECLTGRPPFQADNLMALFAKLLLEEAPRLAEARPDLPPRLDVLMARLLAKDPTSRPANGAALEAELATLDALGTEETDEVPTLADEPAAAGLTDVEARFVSILALHREPVSGALDAKGSTERSQADVVAAVRHEVAPLGARVDELRNGALVVTLLGAGEPTDRAARAARAALRLRAILPDAAIALATGRAEASARLPVGEVVDRVAALLERENVSSTKPPVDVHIDDVTRALLDARFDVTSTPSGHRLVAERPSGEAARTLLGRPSPFVGRDRELRMVRDLVDAAIEEERPSAVLLIGVAGAGKSRFLAELVTRLRQDRPDVLVARGHGDLLGQGSPYALLGSTLLGALVDAPFEGRARLAAFVRKYLPESDAERVSELVAELIGLPFSDEASPRLRASRQSPALMKDHVREAVVDLLAAMTRRHPVVLALEDVQWGDAVSLRLLDAAMRELGNRPFLVLAAARPEALTLFPRLFGDRSHEVRLAELPRKASARITRHALGDAAPAELVDALVERAAGNPFYLEELVRAVAEGRGGMLPETVLGMIEARLGALDPPARRVLRAASVFGESFFRGGIPALLGDDAPDEEELSAVLASLIEREILVARRESRLAGEEQLAFRHMLLCEGAYAMLTERDRALGHRLAGEWLEAHGEWDPKILAAHFDRGGDAARAIRHYERAAQHALGAGDDEAALALAQRGLALGATGDRAAAFRAIQTDAWAWNGDWARAFASAEATLSLATPGTTSHCRALGSAITSPILADKPDVRATFVRDLARVQPEPAAIPAFAWAYSVAIMPYLFGAQRELAEAHLARLEEVTAPFLDREPSAAGWVKMTRAFWQRYVPRDFAAALALDREALAHFEAAGDRRYGPYVQMHVGLDWSYLGAFEQAEAALARAMQSAEPGSMMALASRTYLGRVLLLRGRPADAIEPCTAVYQEAEARGERTVAVNTALLLAEAALAAGFLEAARTRALALEPLVQSLPFARVALAGICAGIALAEGRPAEALALAEPALSDSAQRGMYHFGHEHLVLSRVDALRALGRGEEARAAVLSARADLFLRASRIPDPLLRQTFLERIPTHAALLARAEEWLSHPPAAPASTLVS